MTATECHAYAARRACQLRIDAGHARQCGRADIAAQLRGCARHYLNMARYAALKG